MNPLSEFSLVVCELGNNGYPMRQEPCFSVLSHLERRGGQEGGRERPFVCICVLSTKKGGKVFGKMCVCEAEQGRYESSCADTYMLCLLLGFFCSFFLQL